MNDSFVLLFGIAAALVLSLLIWFMDLTYVWGRRGFFYMIRLFTGLVGVMLGPAEGRFPNARLIEVSICQECGYAGPLGQPVCPRCAQTEKERQL